MLFNSILYTLGLICLITFRLLFEIILQVPNFKPVINEEEHLKKQTCGRSYKLRWDKVDLRYCYEHTRLSFEPIRKLSEDYVKYGTRLLDYAATAIYA